MFLEIEFVEKTFNGACHGMLLSGVILNTFGCVQCKLCEGSHNSRDARFFIHHGGYRMTVKQGFSIMSN